MKDIHWAGTPQTLVTDGAKEETKGGWEQTCMKYRIKQEVTFPHSPRYNLAESSIREIKKSVVRLMRKSGAPRRLWNLCGEHVAAIRRMTASNIPNLQGKSSHEHATGRIPNITPHCSFGWYEPVEYWTPTMKFPEDKTSIGRWVGVALSLWLIIS